MSVWEEYFPNVALLAGIGYADAFDANSCKRKMRCFNGDQSDVGFLESVLAQSGGRFDVIIDDGSHIPAHQFITLNRLLQPDAIVAHGLYIVEDVETSYWRSDATLFGYKIDNGGLNAPCSFVERAKRFVDVINREYVNANYHTTKSRVDQRIASVQFAQNVVIFRVAAEDEMALMGRAYGLGYQAEGVSENKTQAISNLCDALALSGRGQSKR